MVLIQVAGVRRSLISGWPGQWLLPALTKNQTLMFDPVPSPCGISSRPYLRLSDGENLASTAVFLGIP